MRFVFFVGLAMLSFLVQAKDYNLLSPDGHVKILISLNEGKPAYTVVVGDKTPIQNAALGLKLNPAYHGVFNVVNTQKQEVDETYEITWWKNRLIRNQYNGMTLFLEEAGGNRKRLAIEFRSYNDGIAFRYAFPEQKNLKEFVIEEDLSEFAFTDDYTWWSANGERDNLGPLSINAAKDPVFAPMVLECANDLYLGIHEAAIYDFANFKIKPAGKANAFQCDLQGPSNAKTGMHTSWRVIMIGQQPGDLVESNLLQNLNPPCKIEDTSWIKPGLTMWDWRVWGFTAPDGFVYGLNTASHKRFIDFAAENNVDYLLMDADWYGPEFSEKSDPTQSAGEIDIEENFRYAKAKGVGIILYLNDVGANKFGLERVLKQFHDWGASGVKYGFMTSTGQAKVLQTRRVVELCAKYKLTVNFHDNPIPPNGDDRTWPNVLTREYCHSQADAKYSYYPETAVSAAFINMLAGPLDMCSGWYGFEGNEVRPKVFRFIPGTVAAENAKLVVFHSGISVLADSPENYKEKADLFDFVINLPKRYDEYKVIDGHMESHITVARRAGEHWYLGSLTTREPRTLSLKLDFLNPGEKYKAFLFEDASDTHFITNREAYQTRFLEVDTESTLTIKVAPGGGASVRIEPINK
ncbi:glycoside hydrolase family 97 protein [Sunxiuqinia elliptica]|uniref:Alpha-glucosidase n=1 Tax=Sunxiuqinia elliptica TaxID=655355 RepID=A0A1I2GU91_9BACT|nr:glycoside hydrolase family 97 protein [Sunxiuqinia elliptica]SFF21032.1 alpha-glucosidase [Sunxiuqinia elliptica]